MLALREDIFDGYSEPAFADALRRQARIVREATISASDRRLYWYDLLVRPELTRPTGSPPEVRRTA
jgi:hypothetical protein